MARAKASAPAPDPALAWTELADVALRRLAVLQRSGRNDSQAPRTEEPVESRAALDASLAESRARFASSLHSFHPFSSIVSNARLTVAEAEVLAVALAVEVEPDRQRLVAYVNDDADLVNGAGRVRLTLHALTLVFGRDHPGPATVGYGSNLRRAALVDVLDDGPWASHTVVPRASLMWALAGETALDPELPTGARFVAVDDDAGDGFTVVTGGDRLRRHREAALRTAGSRFLVVDQPHDDAGWRAVVAEATITGAGVILEILDELTPVGRSWIERAVHLPWAISTRVDLPLAQLPDRQWTEYVAPDHDVTDEEWEAVFGPATPRTHRLSPTQVDLVGRALVATGGDFDAAVRRLVSGRLEKLARRIRPTRSWDDLVLPAESLEQLHGIVDRYRLADRVYDEWGFSARPSRGLVALFSGPSGTGKTMTTEIIAHALGLDVFKLDLSAVVSKYIGETEKNLEEVFDAAGAGNLVLFFDEADALFGKRSEVRDARDRYANVEVSYLLQRLEAYDGVVVLATNFEKNVDEAFVRRIHARVEFAMPRVAERRAIWLNNVPASAPVKDLDVDLLAQRFELSGGSIRNAAVHAAFLAAAADSPITTQHAIRGVGREYRKTGKLIKAEDFGDHYALVAPLSGPK